MFFLNGWSRENFCYAVSARGGSNKESEGSRTSFAGGFFSILDVKSVCSYSKSESEGSRTSFASGFFLIHASGVFVVSQPRKRRVPAIGSL
jgi:hypothetical protein